MVMNKIEIIGNLTRDPQLRTVNAASGTMNVCDMTVAVNRRRNGPDGKPLTEFYRVSAWGKLGESCAKWLVKGKKVYVSGEPTCRPWQHQDGSWRASMEITAQEIEFLSPAQSTAQGDGYSAPVPPPADPSGYTPVDTDELPF